MVSKAPMGRDGEESVEGIDVLSFDEFISRDNLSETSCRKYNNFWGFFGPGFLGDIKRSQQEFQDLLAFCESSGQEENLKLLNELNMIVSPDKCAPSLKNREN